MKTLRIRFLAALIVIAGLLVACPSTGSSNKNNLKFNVSSISFKKTAAGQNRTTTIKLINSGTSPATGQLLLEQNQVFKLRGSNTLTVAPSSSKIVELRFSPKEAVSYTDKLSLKVGGKTVSSITVSGHGSEMVVHRNEKIAIPYNNSGQNLEVLVDGNKITDFSFSNGRILFDLDIPRDYKKESVQIVVRVQGKEVFNKAYYLESLSLADSKLNLFLKNISRSELEKRLKGSSFTIVSYQKVADGSTATATLKYTNMTTSEALDRLEQIQTLSTQANQELVADYNYDYSIAGFAPHSWSSPSCEGIKEINAKMAGKWQKEELSKILKDLKIEKAQAQGLSGKDVTLAMIDTGYGENDVFDCPETSYKDGHGSHVANIIKAIAKDINLLSLQACESDGKCSSNTVSKALLETEKYIAQGKVIINMSLNGGVYDDEKDHVLHTILKHMQTLHDNNVIIIASTGNHGISSDSKIARKPTYPASYSPAIASSDEAISNVVSVGSVGLANNSSSFSNSPTNPIAVPVDVLAPAIRLCLPDGGACAPGKTESGITGSSFATAIVSGVSALYWSENKCPQLSGTELRKFIKKVASDNVEASSYKLVNADPSNVCSQELPLQVVIVGRGKVKSQDGKIDCAAHNSGSCLASFRKDSLVKLSASADTNFQFMGWAGACNGSDSNCEIKMNTAKAVNASFAPKLFVKWRVDNDNFVFNSKIGDIIPVKHFKIYNDGNKSGNFQISNIDNWFSFNVTNAEIAAGKNKEVIMTVLPCMATGDSSKSFTIAGDGSSILVNVKRICSTIGSTPIVDWRVDKSELSFSSKIGISPPNQQFTIFNDGNKDGNFNISGLPAWINLDHTNAEVMAGNHKDITVITLPCQSIGTRNNTLTISGDGDTTSINIKQNCTAF